MNATETNDLRAFFDTHPEATFAYVFFDGRIEEDVAFFARLSSRTAQLVSIATEGFPVLRSRLSVYPELALQRVKEEIVANHPRAARLATMCLVRQFTL